MILLQLSAAQGPSECCLAVAKALQCVLKEAAQMKAGVSIAEQEPGPQPGTLQSVLLALDGAGAAALGSRWSGTLQWICPSPYRPGHPRKNWFIGGAVFVPPAALADGGIRIETVRASGPGGQHVNKTDSAVRATHLASGISVKVQSQRSQHANRRLALLLIAHRLAQRQEIAGAALRAQRRMFHHGISRGNPVRTFRGEDWC
jgi:peptide chain release factor